MEVNKKNSGIKILMMDVDGTLTDGKIYIGTHGELFKAFDVRDGYGIREILPRYGIEPVILTARKSKITAFRCQELEIRSLHQGIRDKLAELDIILAEKSADGKKKYSLENAAYIGDDMPDLSCIRAVKAGGGITGCPADAAEAVKKESDFVCKANGGNGAVREFIDWITGWQRD